MRDDETRSDDEAPDAEPADEVEPTTPPVRPSALVRVGCFALIAMGGLYVLFAVPTVTDPASSRCSAARTLIEDANDDDEDFNDVDTEGRNPDDIECDEAIPLASRIPEDENGEDFKPLPSEDAIRTQGIIVTILGLGQAVAGFLTARTLSRRARTTSVAIAVLGTLLLPGLLSIVILGFVVYALTFSPAARAIWPPTGASLFRRRPVN